MNLFTVANLPYLYITLPHLHSTTVSSEINPLITQQSEQITFDYVTDCIDCKCKRDEQGKDFFC